MPDNNKSLLEKWKNSVEAKQIRKNFKLSQAGYLKELFRQSADPGNLLEMVLDFCNENLRKDQGTFYTPPKTAYAMVKRAVDWFFKENSGDFSDRLKNIKILDPACGCGEFLLAAIKVLLEKYRETDPDYQHNVHKYIKWIIRNNLYGMDCNDNALELLLERMQLLAGEMPDKTHIIQTDTLNYFYSGKCFKEVGKFDIVIGNPPYVSYGLRNVGKISRARAEELKKRFVNSAEYKLNIYALFMEFAINSTRDNGIHSFIVPDSFLTGQYFTKLRNFMLQNCSFREFFFIRQKLFRAVPGSLVIYFAAGKKADRKNTFSAAMAGDTADFTLPESGYKMLQSEFAGNHRQRFRLFFDEKTHRMVKNMEAESICRLGDLLKLSSGIIGKNGKASIISDKPVTSSFKPGVTSGKAIPGNGKVLWDGMYINSDKDAIKSGISNVDYNSAKIMIRQTGDRIIAGVDYNNLLALNNIHIGNSQVPDLDLEELCSYLNSPEMVRYYQAITLESGRAMAQIDLETLRELPVICKAIRKKS